MRLLAVVPLIASGGVSVMGSGPYRDHTARSVPPVSRFDEVLGYLVLQNDLVRRRALLAWRRPGDAVGWLWQPLRRWADGRLLREPLRDEVDLDTVRGELISAVRDVMAPAHASVWLRERAR